MLRLPTQTRRAESLGRGLLDAVIPGVKANRQHVNVGIKRVGQPRKIAAAGDHHVRQSHRPAKRHKWARLLDSGVSRSSMTASSKL